MKAGEGGQQRAWGEYESAMLRKLRAEGLSARYKQRDWSHEESAFLRKILDEGVPSRYLQRGWSEEEMSTLLKMRKEGLPLRAQQEMWTEADLIKMKEMTLGGRPVSSRPEKWTPEELAKIKELTPGEQVVLRELLKRDARFASREAMMNSKADGFEKMAHQEIGRIAEIFFPRAQLSAPIGRRPVDIAEDAEAREEVEEATNEPWKRYGISEAEYMALQSLEEGGASSRSRKQKEMRSAAAARADTSNTMESGDEKLWGPEAKPTSPTLSDAEWMANAMQFREQPEGHAKPSQANIENPYSGQPQFSTNSSRQQSEKSGSNTTRWVIISSLLTGLVVWNVRPGDVPNVQNNGAVTARPVVSTEKAVDKKKKPVAEEASLSDAAVQLKLAEEQNRQRVLAERRSAEQQSLKAKATPPVQARKSGWFWE